MKTQKNLIRIYTGTEVSIMLLKGEFDEKGISCMIRNDFQSVNTAGFSEAFLRPSFCLFGHLIWKMRNLSSMNFCNFKIKNKINGSKMNCAILLPLLIVLFLYNIYRNI